MRPGTGTRPSVSTPYDHPVHAAAFEFAVGIYEVTKLLPTDERFGLTAQLRRAATSIVANLTEGTARLGARQLHHFVGIAYGSARECEVLLRLCIRIGYLNEAQGISSLETVRMLSRQLLGIARALRKRNNTGAL